MGADIQPDMGTATTLREVCDKGGSRMQLQGSTYGFERGKCPT
jgi:hypothetical protein